MGIEVVGCDVISNVGVGLAVVGNDASCTVVGDTDGTFVGFCVVGIGDGAVVVGRIVVGAAEVGAAVVGSGVVINNLYTSEHALVGPLQLNDVDWAIFALSCTHDWSELQLITQSP